MNGIGLRSDPAEPPEARRRLFDPPTRIDRNPRVSRQRKHYLPKQRRPVVFVARQQFMQECRTAPGHTRDENRAFDPVRHRGPSIASSGWRAQARFQKVAKMHARKESPERMQIRLAHDAFYEDRKPGFEFAIIKIFEPRSTPRCRA
jgi:hypothetical protein